MERIQSFEEYHNINEAQSGDKKDYTKYVKDTLKKYNVTSPSELKGDEKSKFFKELDAGWESKEEKGE